MNGNDLLAITSVNVCLSTMIYVYDLSIPEQPSSQAPEPSQATGLLGPADNDRYQQ